MSQIQVELQEFMGSDRSVAEAAWTSSLTLQGKTKRSDEDVKKVIQFLIEHKHASPVEMVVLRFWIKMPLAVDRQHMTHRLGSHNGMSGRYRTMPPEFFNLSKDVENILVKAQRGIYGATYPDKIQKYYDLCNEANIWYQNEVKFLKEAEKAQIISNDELKRAREFLRGVLPQHNMTERITVFNLRSFANYQKLRNSEHAQPEIRQVAQLMLEEVKKKEVAKFTVSMLESKKWEI